MFKSIVCGSLRNILSCNALYNLQNVNFTWPHYFGRDYVSVAADYAKML